MKLGMSLESRGSAHRLEVKPFVTRVRGGGEIPGVSPMGAQRNSKAMATGARPLRNYGCTMVTNVRFRVTFFVLLAPSIARASRKDAS